MRGDKKTRFKNKEVSTCFASPTPRHPQHCTKVTHPVKLTQPAGPTAGVTSQGHDRMITHKPASEEEEPAVFAVCTSMLEPHLPGSVARGTDVVGQ